MSSRKSRGELQPNKSPAARDPASDGPEKLVFLFTRTYAVYQKVLSSLLREFDLDSHLRPGMGDVLFALFSENGLSAGELSDKLGVPKSTMTGVIAGLEDNGVVESRPDDRDQRVNRLYLTRRGRSLEPRCRQLTDKLTSIFGGDLDPGDVETFNELLAGLLLRLRVAAEPRER